jgi:hypothetical protein
MQQGIQRRTLFPLRYPDSANLIRVDDPSQIDLDSPYISDGLRKEMRERFARALTTFLSCLVHHEDN